MKQYPAYRPSGVDWLGEIPTGWECKDLKRMTRFAYGNSLSDENRNGGEIPVYGSNGIVGFHDTPITSSPCIIVGRKGSFGKINFSDKPCFPIDTSYFIDNTQTKCDLKWLSYYLSVLKLDGNTLDDTVPGLSREWAYRMPGLIIPLPEQQAIVRYLDYKTALIDKCIANRERQMGLLREQLREKIFSALTKGLHNKRFKMTDLHWFTEIPDNWEMVRFNTSIKLFHGFQFRDNHFTDEGAKVVKITQLKADGTIDLSEANFVHPKYLETLKKKIIVNGDILMALTGGTIGKIIRVEKLEESVLQNYRVGKFIPKDNKALDKDFMFWVLSSEFTYAQILYLQRETGQPNIGIGDFSKMFFPLPNTLEEQAEIVSYIIKEKTETDTLITKYKKQIDLMQEYHTALISQAVTGKIDVREWMPRGQA